MSGARPFLRGGLAAMAGLLPLLALAQATAPARPVTAADPGSIRVLLSPELETTLVAQMPGRIASLRASLGAPVARGQTVVAFDCDEQRARWQMAQAEQASAAETLQVKTQLNQLEAAGETEVQQARTAVQRAEAAVALARAQMAQCTVTAPFSGRVVKVHVKPHQGVAAGAPLVELVSDGPLKLRLNVPSKLLRQLKVGTAFEVDIDETGRTYPAKVSAINARVDAVAQTIELEGRIQGQFRELLPGMSGVARFPATP